MNRIKIYDTIINMIGLFIIEAIVATILFYLFAFIAWSLDPGEWHVIERALAISVLIAWNVLFVIPESQKKK